MAKPRVRDRFADPTLPGSFAFRARARRWDRFATLFPDLADMSVIDLGGTAAFWQEVPVRPSHLTLVNPAATPDPSIGWAEVVIGDACDPPASVTGRTFDLAYSNSTIEHVGGHQRRRLFADVVQRLGRHLWVQTPYRYFPIEPHFVFPLFQHLPVAARTSAMAHWPLRPSDFPTDKAQIREEVMGIDLLSISDMRSYFPDMDLEYERVLGVVKSLIAVR